MDGWMEKNLAKFLAPDLLRQALPILQDNFPSMVKHLLLPQCPQWGEERRKEREGQGKEEEERKRRCKMQGRSVKTEEPNLPDEKFLVPQLQWLYHALHGDWYKHSQNPLFKNNFKTFIDSC
ncbi:hypothetical protein GBF38_018517, partial [Nibea albiflora]